LVVAQPLEENCYCRHRMRLQRMLRKQSGLVREETYASFFPLATDVVNAAKYSA
jgi:hypothetical protein